LFLIHLGGVQTYEDKFSEELYIKRLPNSFLYTHFQFTTVAKSRSTATGDHYALFPKSLGQIVKKFGVTELHLSLTHGRWRHHVWGYPVSSMPYGVELWAWFSPQQSQDSIDSKWTGLVNALSGQFCASLNYLKTSVSVSPLHTFKPMGLWPKDKLNVSDYLRYAALPREMVCTENLTPWRKLLPCRNKAGLATLFNALHLYESSFHSLGIHLRSICKDDLCSEARLELKQTLSSVYDPAIADVKEAWSFSKVFGDTLKSSCPLAYTSKVLVSLPQNQGAFGLKLEPEPLKIESKVVANTEFKYAIYNLKKLDFKQDFNLRGTYLNTKGPEITRAPSITVHRYTTGYGEEKGGIASIISNHHAIRAVKLVYFEVIPWYIPVNLYSLKVKFGNRDFKPGFLSFIPAKDRRRPTSIEMILTVPPNSTLKLSYSFRRSFLKWTEHPPDSHHGYYIGSAVVSTVLPDSQFLTGISERCTTMSG